MSSSDSEIENFDQHRQSLAEYERAPWRTVGARAQQEPEHDDDDAFIGVGRVSRVGGYCWTQFIIIFLLSFIHILLKYITFLNDRLDK